MIGNKLKQLKEEVCEANLKLIEHSLVFFTFGNVSGIDKNREIVAIKPSGVDYSKLRPDDIVLIDLEGKPVGKGLKPSSDTKTHLELYKSFENIGGICHTHSTYATSFAQAGLAIKCIGTTHADYFFGEIPCTEVISDFSINLDYEQETGKLIINTFMSKKINYNLVKACLVSNHGPFTWGENALEAVRNSVILEQIAKTNFFSYLINPNLNTLKETLMEKHFFRKHGENAYYGQ